MPGVEEKKVLLFRKLPSADDARKLAAQISEEGNVTLTSHARKRMKERDISFEQILTCLKKGVITEGPCQCKDGYKITMQRVAAGEMLDVVFVIQFSLDALVITIF